SNCVYLGISYSLQKRQDHLKRLPTWQQMHCVCNWQSSKRRFGKHDIKIDKHSIKKGPLGALSFLAYLKCFPYLINVIELFPGEQLNCYTLLVFLSFIKYFLNNL